MCDTVFAFGQRGGYLLECPSWRIENRLPPELKSLHAAGSVTHTYCMALGAKESYVITYKGTDGFLHIQTSGLPQSLRDWLMETDASGSPERTLQKLRVSLGPYNKSYYASDGISTRWQNLPPALLTRLEELRKPGGGWTDAPRIVALGAMSNFVIITEQKSASWILGNYRELNSAMDMIGKKDGSVGLIHNLVLDPYRFGAYILQSSNGIVLQSHIMPHAASGVATMSEKIKADTVAELSRKQQAGMLEAQRQQLLQWQEFEQQMLRQQANSYASLTAAMLAMNLGMWMNN